MHPLLSGPVFLLRTPELTVRALDDLHLLATSARDVVTLLQSLEARATAIERRAGDIQEAIDQALALGGRLERTADAVIDEGRQVRDAARDVSAQAMQVVAVLPLLERAIGLAVPLEGAVERLGRVVDRLPRAERRPRTPSSPG